MKKKLPKLSDKHDKFVRCYLKYWNATRAYTETYPGSTYAAARASALSLLAKPSIKAYIEDHKTQAMKDNKIELDKILSQMNVLASSNMQDFLNCDGNIDVSQLSREQMAAIESIETEEYYDKGLGQKVIKHKIKLYNKYQAIKTMGQHLGGFIPTSKVEVSDGTGLADRLAQGITRLKKSKSKE